MSFFRNHKMKIQAAQASKAAADSGEPLENSTAYELMLGQIATHQRQLSQIKSIERRAEVKKDILPEYQAYIDGVLAAQAGVQDDVLMTVLVWMIDCGVMDMALTIAEYALNYDLKMPERFRRDTATLVVEEMAGNSLKNNDNIDGLESLLELTGDRDMPDQVLAKLHKALGLSYEKQDGDSAREQAISHLSRALDLNAKCGVKKILDKLEREKKKAEEAT